MKKETQSPWQSTYAKVLENGTEGINALEPHSAEIHVIGMDGWKPFAKYPGTHAHMCVCMNDVSACEDERRCAVRQGEREDYESN